MMPTNKNTWAQPIYRRIFEVLILLVASTLFAAGYLTWCQSSFSRIQSLSNNYHLASITHYNKAMQELRHTQIELIHESSGAYIDTKLQTKSTSPLNEDNHTALFYLIRREIQAGLGLQHTFSDGRFNSLTVKLTRQFSNYSENNQNHLQKSTSLDQIAADTKELLITLNQLERLHSAIRDDQLIELDAMRNRHNSIFYLLSLVLLFIGCLIIRRSFIAIGVVISTQVEAEEEIRNLAFFDSLTRLPNRTLVLDRLTQLINEGPRDKGKVAVLFLDLDDFKKVNDTLGHDIGDKLLIDVSGRLKSAVRSSDTVGRLGGDEFIVILGRVADETDIIHVVENLFDQIRNTFNIDGHDMMLSASAGISVYPEDGGNVSELLRKADSAMFHSKNLGRNTYSFFTDAMNRNVLRRLALEKQMHGALTRGEFEVVYQPQVDLNCDRIMGAEALLRWYNPTLGNVSPEEFIPIAEQTGLIVPIGQYVLTEALRMTARWQKEHDPEFRIAVNLSPRQFRAPKLVSDIKKAMQQSGISYRYLELEITEGVLMDSHSGIDHALAELDSLGVNIALDDFGTGYSSLTYLRNYPFDVVKIDRSFISNIVVSPKDRALVNSAISMGHSLNLKVIAEGVETEEQLAHLKEMRCDHAQGYLFSKPVSERDLTGMLEPKDSKTLVCA